MFLKHKIEKQMCGKQRVVVWFFFFFKRKYVFDKFVGKWLIKVINKDNKYGE